MSKYKVGDVIYYDELELHGKVMSVRYHACVIQDIRDNKEVYGKWCGFNYIPTEQEVKIEECKKPWSWMYDNEVHLISPIKKNKRIIE